MKKTWILLGVAVAVLGGGTAWFVQNSRTKDLIAASVPTRPDLANAPLVVRTRLDEAEKLVREGKVEGLDELSRLYHANGFLDEALVCYERLEVLRPKEPKYPHRHAAILAGFGDVQSALALWTRVVSLDPKYVPARLRYADSLLKSGREADAARAYEAILRDFPDEPYAHLGLARMDFEAGRLQVALQRLEKLVQLTNYRLGYDLIVTAYERLGQRDKAEAIRGLARSFGTYRDATDPWMDELFDDCYDSYRLAVVGGMAKVNGDDATAFRMLERAVQVSPKDVSARFQLGMMYRDRKDFKAAREQLQQCTVLAPDFPDAWAHLSGILRDAGDMAGADRLISIGLQNCPQSPGLHLMRARRLSDLGRMPEAIEEYKTSIRYRPNEADGYVELAVALFKLERSEEAVAILRKAIEVEPQHTDALGFLAIHAISSGNETEARRWMAQIRTQPRVRGEQLERIQSAFREKFGRNFE